MRKLRMFFFIAAMLTGLSIFSQPNARVFVKAGINSTGVSISSGSQYVKNETRNGVSWSAGGQLELIYPGNIILFAGLNAYSYNYKINSTLLTSQPITYKGIYNPVFLNIPAGIGYHWQISDKTEVNFYAGAYINIGAAGSIRAQYISAANPQYRAKQDINFGNKENSNLRSFNWGFQPGISIGFKRYQVALNYQIGMNNIAPDSYREVHKLNSASLSIKYQLNLSTKNHSKRNNSNKY